MTQLTAFVVYFLAFMPVMILASLIVGFAITWFIIAPIKVWHGWGWREDDTNTK